MGLSPDVRRQRRLPPPPHSHTHTCAPVRPPARTNTHTHSTHTTQTHPRSHVRARAATQHTHTPTHTPHAHTRVRTHAHARAHARARTHACTHARRRRGVPARAFCRHNRRRDTCAQVWIRPCARQSGPAAGCVRARPAGPARRPHVVRDESPGSAFREVGIGYPMFEAMGRRPRVVRHAPRCSAQTVHAPGAGGMAARPVPGGTGIGLGEAW